MDTTAEALYSVELERLDGTRTTLGEYESDVLLIVNVASECGLTPQYRGLQALYEANRARGFEVLGFPCNQFGAQEPGSNEQIAQFCSLEYRVSFPMFSKIEVNGTERHPLYRALIGDGGDITWNFEKFVIDRSGHVVARFSPNATPEDADLLACIQTALG